jgi:hypothetical protein
MTPRCTAGARNAGQESCPTVGRTCEGRDSDVTLRYSDIDLSCDDLPGVKRGAATSCTGTGDGNPLDLSVVVVDDLGALEFTDQGSLELSH